MKFETDLSAAATAFMVICHSIDPLMPFPGNSRRLYHRCHGACRCFGQWFLSVGSAIAGKNPPDRPVLNSPQRHTASSPQDDRFRQLSCSSTNAAALPLWVGFSRSLPFRQIRCTVQICCSAIDKNRPISDLRACESCPAKRGQSRDIDSRLPFGWVIDGNCPCYKTIYVRLITSYVP